MKTGTCIVTGGNAGIGKAIATSLAGMKRHVAIVSRNPEKGEAALRDIRKESGNGSVELVVGNLGTIASTKKLAATLIDRFPDASALVNNAGVWMTRRLINEDGLEYSFMVNHLAPFILSNILLPALKRNAPARVVNVNAGLYVFGALDLYKTPYGHDFSRLRTYMNTKLCNTLFTREFAGIIQGSGVTVNALHPGVIRTNLGDTPGVFGFLLRRMKWVMAPPERGARAPVWLATAPELEGVNGKFFMLKKEIKYSENARDPDLAKRLWKLSAELSGVGIHVAS